MHLFVYYSMINNDKINDLVKYFSFFKNSLIYNNNKQQTSTNGTKEWNKGESQKGIS